METKEQLIKCIKDWVKIDNEIRQLTKEQVTRRNEKKKISAVLMDIMRKNEIDCFDIKDGQIMYNKKQVKKPINQKNLLELLSKFYEGDSLKASEVNQYIFENRETVVKENIVRKIYKVTDMDIESDSVKS
jgi:hypothetical protein